MDTGKEILRRTLEEAPGSIRELAREADVNETLLRKVRDGERRLTPETRDAVAGALRRWEGTCRELAEALEAAKVKSRDNPK